MFAAMHPVAAPVASLPHDVAILQKNTLCQLHFALLPFVFKSLFYDES